MSLRATIVKLLEDAGHVVVHWGAIRRGRFLVVRPAGIDADRAIVEVWIINPRASSMGDPDEGLAEYTDGIYLLLRRHLLEPAVAAGPPYDPTGKAEHATMILTGSSPVPLGLGDRV